MFSIPINNNLVMKKNNFRFDDFGYFQTLKSGTFFYPAWKHYGVKMYVSCDRCNRQNLEVSLGYGKYDLCLLCVDELTRKNFDCPNGNCFANKNIEDLKLNMDYFSSSNYYVECDLKNKNIGSNEIKQNYQFATDNFRFESIPFYKTIETGIFYYPAMKHYNKVTNVICDRCNKQNLSASVGHDKFDLCLSCVYQLTKKECDGSCRKQMFINDNSVQYNEY